MDEMTQRKNKILALMKEPSYVPMKEKELAILMQVEPDDRPVLRACLDALLRDGMISVSKRGKYMLPESRTLTGVFSSSGHGYGFVHVEGIEDDFFISEKDTGTALHGDTVLIDPYEVPFRGKRRNAGKSREAVVVDVIERETDLIVGTYDAAKNHYGFVIPDSTRIDRDIFVPLEYSMNAVDGHKVVVKITDFGDQRRNPEGRIVEILGHSADPGIDILSILKAYGVETEFPDKVLKQAQKVPQELRPTDYRGREDIRDLDMVTIDGPDSKDLDDAVSLTMDGDDYILGVHIADVTHYVKEGSAIDREALDRGTSCYPVDRVVPMLPQQLCNGICSLNESVDRLALSCFMTIDKKGVIKDHRFALTVINTNHRMIYGDVDKIITDHDESLMEKYADVFEYVRSLIAFRKEHPVIHRDSFFEGHNSSGYPELSCHGEKPWELDRDQPFLVFGFMYAEPAADFGTKRDSFIYCAVNEHWEEHAFELPVIPEGMKWRIVLYSGDPENKRAKEVCKDRVRLMPRSVMLLLGSKHG